MPNATEVPLSLKRSLSQACDPHMAYITIELGSFEDTVGRVDTALSTPKGYRSTTFSYRVAAKIPVDKVGIHSYPLDWSEKQGHTSSVGDEMLPDIRSLGWIIVRVALEGGIKMVTVESPLIIKNVCNADFLCEARDHDGLTLLWRSLVPRFTEHVSGCLSVPADLVPIIHSESCMFTVVALPPGSSFQHESDIPSLSKALFTRLCPPQPYSSSSLSKGIIDAVYESFSLLNPDKPNDQPSKVHFHLCSARIGSVALDPSPKGQRVARSELEVPEQRMFLFRSPLAVVNHLAFPIRVQVNVKQSSQVLAQVQEGLEHNGSKRGEKSEPWFDLGIIDCGDSVSWSAAAASESIELRVRFEGRDGTVNREFPCWSTTTTVAAEKNGFSSPARASAAATPSTRLQDLKVLDLNNDPLMLSVDLSRKTAPGDLASSCDNIKQYSEEIPLASRVVSIFAPFWIVDSTGLDLQYKSGSILAGQSDLGSRRCSSPDKHEVASSLGLGELLDDNDLTYLPSRLSFEVLMIGHDQPKRLYVRRRQTRVHTLNILKSPWSEAIPLTMNDSSYHDTTVFSGSKHSLAPAYAHEAFALRSRLVHTPTTLGGMFGTKILHVVCRYGVVNELGRDIEICEWNKEHQTTFKADTRPRPFHFDDSSPIQFRPKEFGWMWSGRFRVRRSQRELVICLKHKLKSLSIIVSVEFHSKHKAGTCLIVFRLATHPPYRVENRTNYPIQFHQISSIFDIDWIFKKSNNSSGTLILPYHDAEFAWNEPEFGKRSIAFRLTDLGDTPASVNGHLGTFQLDSITPGTRVSLTDSNFMGQVISDGPTRVIRIVEAIKLGSDGEDQSYLHDDFHKIGEDVAPSILTWSFIVKASHGIGVSIVDWSPQELLYICFDDLVLDQVNDGTKEVGSASVGRITVNNQLWVTPYPVMLRMGLRSSRRRNRRHCAVALSWSRKVTTPSYGDMTIWESIELSTEPAIISVDGNLATFLIGMIHHARNLGDVGRGGRRKIARNAELRRILDIAKPLDEEEDERKDTKSLIASDLYLAVDYVATSAIAAKLRSRYIPPSQTARLSRTNHPPETIHHDVLSKRWHKCCIERLRISTTAAEISWSGALPIASKLPALLRPALTFEGLPVLLRPFSLTHACGTTHDILQSLKSHYVSIWRGFDLLVGVLANPAFLVRACIFTWREAFSTGIDIVSTRLAASESALLELTSSQNPSVANSQWSSIFYNAVVLPVMNLQATVLHGLATSTIAWSSMLHYSAANHHGNSGLVRSRNPRLFANVDGQDLLVGYVEGENAGRALLSRVRMGAHLSEGYLSHIEDVHIVKSWPKHQTDIDPSKHILMLTYERILLLNGQLNAFFCDVVWEALFADLVHIEFREVADVPSCALIFLWFMQDDGSSSQEDRQARTLVYDAGGLGALVPKELFVSKASLPLLLDRVKSIDPRLVDVPNSSHTVTQ